MKIRPLLASCARLAPLALLLPCLSLAQGMDTSRSAARSVGAVAAADSAGAESTAADSTIGADLLASAPAPPRDYIAEIRANFSPENHRYSDLKTVLQFIGPLYGVLAGLLVLFSGLSARMRDIAHGLGSSRWVRVLVYLVFYTALSFVLGFPFAWYDGFAVEHQFGLSNQSFGQWMGEQGKAALLGVVFLGIVPLLWLVYTAIAKSPRRWWLWLALWSLPIIVAGTLIGPLVVEPVFNKFTPLQNQHLKARILDLAARAQIPGRKVYEVDQSKQTKKYNAYVSGFGVSQRIVLWDTTLKGMSEDEILYVMGHEMGHYKLAHIWKGIAFTSTYCLLLFFLTAQLAAWGMRRFGNWWGFGELHDVASLPLLYLVLSIVVFVTQPIAHSYSRRVETEADIYGLEITRDNDAAARAFVKLGAENKSNPEPSSFVRIMLYSHPADIDRLRLAVGYRPWELELPNRFFKGAS